MNSITTHYYDSAVGRLILGTIGDELCLCDWDNPQRRSRIDPIIKRIFNANYIEGSSPAIEHTIAQLNEYFTCKRQTFDLKLHLRGTDFQTETWRALLSVPYGATTSYSALATKLGRPNAVRAVANAVGANPISIIVPCHRIIGSNGTLTGYAGGLIAKRILLSIEQRHNTVAE